MPKLNSRALELSAGAGLTPGDICAIKREDSGFGVIKILVIDQHIIHIRKYKNRFAERPFEIDLKHLSIGTIHDADGFGVGHLPISATSFGSWMPSRICRQEVTEEELEGYHCWLQDQEAGVWD
jgi:hypothetical protein